MSGLPSFLWEKLPQLFLVQVNDYNNKGLNHLDVNVHSGFPVNLDNYWWLLVGIASSAQVLCPGCFTTSASATSYCKGPLAVPKVQWWLEVDFSGDSRASHSLEIWCLEETLLSSHLVLKPRQHFSSNFAGETGCQQERFQLLQEACVALQDCMAAPGSCHGGIVCAMVETPDVGDSSPINNMMGINMH